MLMTTRHRAALLLCGLLMASACSAANAHKKAAAPAPYTDGDQYVTLPAPHQRHSDKGRVEVVEVFSYGCVHCADFSPLAEQLAESLPALIKAWRVQDKARQVGFEWDNIEDVWAKVEEETQELHEVVREGNADRIEDEFGDLMFALVNYSRFLNLDPETALERTNQKFLKRFRYIEEVAAAQGKALTDMTLGEMDAIWNEAKGK